MGFRRGLGSSWTAGRCAGYEVRSESQSAAAEAKALPSAVDISLDVLTSAGSSTARNAELLALKGGAHDPRRRGFTLQQAEFTIAGDFGDELSGTASLIATIDAETGETVTELEEAMLRWRGLTDWLTVEAGLFFTDIGHLNRTHPHERDWLDQPVIHTRLLGGDGMRGPGLRLRMRNGGEEISIGAQNANGETMVSFLASDDVYLERAIGGRAFVEREVRAGGDLVWSMRATHDFQPAANVTLTVGASAALGPNATGAHGETVLYGADFACVWLDEHDDHEHAFAVFEGEVLARAFDTAAQADSSVPGTPVTVPATTLDDYGGYLQGRCAINERWQLGARIEWAGGNGDSYDAANRTFGRAFDPHRGDRLRFSPLLIYAPNESWRVRLQYDLDDADFLSGTQHSLWVGFEVQVGTHRH